MSPVDDDVSRLMHTALSMRFGSSMSRFRAALRAVIADRFEFVPAPPPQRFLARRQPFLDTFFAGQDRRSRLRRAVAESLVTGDWSSKAVHHYCAGCCRSPSDALEKYQRVFVRIMCGCAPPVFPRDSWVGHDLPLDWIGGLEATHALFSAAFERWCAMYGAPSGGAPPTDGAAQEPPLADLDGGGAPRARRSATRQLRPKPNPTAAARTATRRSSGKLPAKSSHDFGQALLHGCGLRVSSRVWWSCGKSPASTRSA